MPGADNVNRNLDEWANRKKAAILMLAEKTAADMEAHAKPNAPWVDRTSHARQGLFGYTRVEGKFVRVRVAHTMDYGVHLELKNQGKYGILKRTASRFANSFFEDVKRLVGAK